MNDVLSGLSWEFEQLPDGNFEFSPAVKREDTRLLAFSPSFGTDQTVFGVSGHSILKSVDGGSSWALLGDIPIRTEAEYSKFDWFLVPVNPIGNWKAGSAIQPGRSLVATENGASVSFDFVGRGLRWIGTHGRSGGISKVYLNGVHQATVDQYARRDAYETVDFSVDDLPFGHHTLVIEVTGTKHKRSRGTRVEDDAFDVIR